MKKLLATIIAAMLAIGVKAQTRELFSATLNGGYSHIANLHFGAFGGYVGFYNVYFGVQFNPADKATSMGVDKWGGQSQIYTYHLGYRFPIRDKYGIIPLVGLTSGAVGWIDGGDWRYDDTYGVVNKFHATDQSTSPDIGIMLDYTTPRVQGIGWKLCAALTLHTASIGVGLYM